MRRLLLTLVVAVLALVVLVLATAPPPPEPPTPPADRDGPWFALQLHKPRTALPLGGVLPDGWLDDTPRVLVLGSDDPGAEVLAAGHTRLHLRADAWELVLERPDGQRLAAGSWLAFPVELAGRIWQLRAELTEASAVAGTFTQVQRPADLVSGTLRFAIEHCVRADTDQPIEWPPGVLTVVGSFADLPLTSP